MEDQIGTVLHWSHQKEPKQAKRKDEVIRRNLDRIHIFSCYSSTLKPIEALQPSEPYSKNNKQTKKIADQKIKYFWLLDHMSDEVEI